MRDSLTFDDVLLVPKFSDIESRSEIDLGVDLFDNFHLTLPIISSPMDGVTGYDMLVTMEEEGGLGILHRFQTDEMLYDDMDCLVMNGNHLSFAIGIRYPEQELERVEHISKFGGGVTDRMTVTIDVAHGHHEKVLMMIAELKDMGIPRVIAGNVATREGFWALAKAGADAIRVGIGGGSACSTRAVTGVGVPQLSAIMDCVEAQIGLVNPPTIIADGGIKNSGDIVKALAAGADAVMLGNLLAGTEEAPGEWHHTLNKSRYKPFRGMSSLGVNGSKYAPEGVAGWVEDRGPVKGVLRNLAGGIRSGMSYVGARNLTELRLKAEFIRVSGGTQLESATRVAVGPQTC